MSIKHKHQTKPFMSNPRSNSVVLGLWDYFWRPPENECPKCGCEEVEYYDPFFFSPIRTLQGRRRLRCIKCRFVWRPKKKGKSALEKVLPRM